jgi:hypothetical protein
MIGIEPDGGGEIGHRTVVVAQRIVLLAAVM